MKAASGPLRRASLVGPRKAGRDRCRPGASAKRGIHLHRLTNDSKMTWSGRSGLGRRMSAMAHERHSPIRCFLVMKPLCFLFGNRPPKTIAFVDLGALHIDNLAPSCASPQVERHASATVKLKFGSHRINVLSSSIESTLICVPVYWPSTLRPLLFSRPLRTSFHQLAVFSGRRTSIERVVPGTAKLHANASCEH